MTACELVSEGSKQERQRDEWLRPAEGGDLIADSRQCESKAGVTTVSPLAEGGGQKATHSTTHSSPSSNAQQNRTAALLSTYCFSLLRVGWTFEDQPVLFVVPGGRRTQVSPWVLCVSELQGGDWGPGYLRLSRAVETLLVRHLYRIFF